MCLPQSLLNAHLDVETWGLPAEMKVNSVSYFLSKPDETRWRKCRLIVKRRNGHEWLPKGLRGEINHESFKRRFDLNRYSRFIESYDIKLVEINY